MLKKTWLGKFLKEFYQSFNDKDGTGFDERKMSGFSVIMTAIVIGLVYAYDMYKCGNPLSWEGVILVGVFLTFGALYLMILNPKQIERILSIIYGAKNNQHNTQDNKSDVEQEGSVNN
jgi:hypothetical protein